jgi:hypothetical protein
MVILKVQIKRIDPKLSAELILIARRTGMVIEQGRVFEMKKGVAS